MSADRDLKVEEDSKQESKKSLLSEPLWQLKAGIPFPYDRIVVMDEVKELLDRGLPEQGFAGIWWLTKDDEGKDVVVVGLEPAFNAAKPDETEFNPERIDRHGNRYRSFVYSPEPLGGNTGIIHVLSVAEFKKLFDQKGYTQVVMLKEAPGVIEMKPDTLPIILKDGLITVFWVENGQVQHKTLPKYNVRGSENLPKVSEISDHAELIKEIVLKFRCPPHESRPYFKWPFPEANNLKDSALRGGFGYFKKNPLQKDPDELRYNSRSQNYRSIIWSGLFRLANYFAVNIEKRYFGDYYCLRILPEEIMYAIATAIEKETGRTQTFKKLNYDIMKDWQNIIEQPTPFAYEAILMKLKETLSTAFKLDRADIFIEAFNVMNDIITEAQEDPSCAEAMKSLRNIADLNLFFFLQKESKPNVDKAMSMHAINLSPYLFYNEFKLAINDQGAYGISYLLNAMDQKNISFDKIKNGDEDISSLLSLAIEKKNTSALEEIVNKMRESKFDFDTIQYKEDGQNVSLLYFASCSKDFDIVNLFFNLDLPIRESEVLAIYENVDTMSPPHLGLAQYLVKKMLDNKQEYSKARIAKVFLSTEKKELADLFLASLTFFLPKEEEEIKVFLLNAIKKDHLQVFEAILKENKAYLSLIFNDGEEQLIDLLTFAIKNKQYDIIKLIIPDKISDFENIKLRYNAKLVSLPTLSLIIGDEKTIHFLDENKVFNFKDAGSVASFFQELFVHHSMPLYSLHFLFNNADKNDIAEMQEYLLDCFEILMNPSEKPKNHIPEKAKLLLSKIIDPICMLNCLLSAIKYTNPQMISLVIDRIMESKLLQDMDQQSIKDIDKKNNFISKLINIDDLSGDVIEHFLNAGFKPFNAVKNILLNNDSINKYALLDVLLKNQNIMEIRIDELTLLGFALERERTLSDCRWLLEHKCDPNYVNDSVGTALHQAIELRNLDLVKLLLEFKANPHIKNKEGASALELLSTLIQNESSKQEGLFQSPALTILNNILKELEAIPHPKLDKEFKLSSS